METVLPVARFTTRSLMQSARPLFLFVALLVPAMPGSAFQIPGAFSASSQASAQSAPEPRDELTRQGPFTVGNQQYTVLLNYKVLPQSVAPTGKSSSTLSFLQILDASGDAVLKETFPYTVNQRHFAERLSAAASLLRGEGGTALAIRFLEQPGASSGTASRFGKESWQLFGSVNGRLAPFGAVLPLGQGTDLAGRGTVAAVMTKGGVAVMPMDSAAEVVALPAWTGNFYVLVPVRFDWPHNQWGEGEECFRNVEGSLTERGCILSVQAALQQRSPDADIVGVQLYAVPDGDTDDEAGHPLNVLVTPSSHVDFLEVQAVVRWHSEGQDSQREECTFSDLWLRTRIDGQEGWVHGQDAFAALGAPLSNPR
jgi:hypothetical protein